MRPRDMSRKAFVASLKRNGFESYGILGYWMKDGIGISEFNYSTRRAALAGILRGYADGMKDRAAREEARKKKA